MKYICRRLGVLFLAVVMVLTTSLIGTAYAVELDGECSLTVDPYDGEFSELEECNIVVELYKVADAIPIEDEDEDGYTFGAIGLYAGLQDTLSSGLTNENIKYVAQKAAEVALYQDTPAKEGAVHTPISVGAGLYLVVVHGAETDSYITTVTDEDGSERIVTSVVAQSHTYLYTPALVALPEQDASGGWVYESEITLKTEQQTRFGSLEIVKTLTGYAEGRPATFVFDIEAVLDGKNVYSNVVSMTFTSAGQQSYVIDKIPVGAEVTVKEVYSGVCYRLTTDGTQTAVISAEDISSVSFTNAPNGGGKDGGGITNKFEYGNDGWTWTPVKHS